MFHPRSTQCYRTAQRIFTTRASLKPLSRPGFGNQKMAKDFQIANTLKDEPPCPWEHCIQDVFSFSASQKASSATLTSPSRLLPTTTYFLTRDPRQTGDIERMLDREPFVTEFVGYCEKEEEISFLDKIGGRDGISSCRSLPLAGFHPIGSEPRVLPRPAYL